MAVPTLKLDLAPPTNLWRMNHGPLGLAALVAGGLLFAASLGFTWRAYAQAASAGQRAVTLVAQTSASAREESQVLAELREVDVAKELPRWRLAEKIFTERSLPWSRLTAELERSLVDDVRLKSIQRTRSSDLRVQLKIKGEARTRAAEANFVESLQKNPFFEAVLLEREAERQGGGVEFDYTLAAQSSPPPFVPLPKTPKYASTKTAVAIKVPTAPVKPRPGQAAPGQAAPKQAAPRQAAPAPQPVRVAPPTAAVPPRPPGEDSRRTRRPFFNRSPLTAPGSPNHPEGQQP